MKMGFALPTSLNVIVLALKQLGKAIALADAKSFLAAVINDMSTNGVSEAQAIERETKFRRMHFKHRQTALIMVPIGNSSANC